jgi:hypothetical protein
MHANKHTKQESKLYLYQRMRCYMCVCACVCLGCWRVDFAPDGSAIFSQCGCMRALITKFDNDAQATRRVAVRVNRCKANQSIRLSNNEGGLWSDVDEADDDAGSGSPACLFFRLIIERLQEQAICVYYESQIANDCYINVHCYYNKTHTQAVCEKITVRQIEKIFSPSGACNWSMVPTLSMSGNDRMKHAIWKHLYLWTSSENAESDIIPRLIDHPLCYQFIHLLTVLPEFP